MTSHTTLTFWKLYWDLSPDIRRRARQAYKLWRDNPAHPGLHFKRVKQSRPIYSVRIGLGHRAVGLLKGDNVTWFWIGNHGDYDRLIK
ncbi:MAG: hypothetical protein HZC40_07170 [Chloroflexi bacterium]|nr:hypothetical protein [Chloroflexota bacterium]